MYVHSVSRTRVVRPAGELTHHYTIWVLSAKTANV